jgi:hypothetical protein
VHGDIALFWTVLFGFLIADSFALAPLGGDFLRFGASGRLRYEPGVRLKFRGRDLVLLNPLNPFDRVVLTRHAAGNLTPLQWRSTRKAVRTPLRALNAMSALGSAYLVSMMVLAGASSGMGFGVVLSLLAAVHLVAWSASVTILLARRKTFGLPTARALSLVVEALFVPGYTVNLSKRVWYRRVLDVPAMAWGLRSLQRMTDPSMRELYCHQMSGRLDDVVAELGLLESEQAAAPPGPSPVDTSPHRRSLNDWVGEARQCLTKSAPQGGW